MSAFTVGQTHGILAKPHNAIEACSDDLGWTSLYASIQREMPYKDSFRATEDHLVILHRDGPVRVTRQIGSERVERTVSPGGLFILPARRDFTVELSGSLSTIHLYIRSSMLRLACEELVDTDPDRIEFLPRLGDHDPMIEGAANAACDLLRSGVTSDWLADGIARMIAGRLVLAHSTASSREPLRDRGGLSNDRLRAVRDYIAAHLDQSLRLDDLARAASLSPIHFSRAFKKATNLTPHQYVIEVRVAQAKRLLGCDLPIAEIAYRCGFSHQEHMTRLFGRMVGQPPAAYRRSLRSSAAVH